MSHPSQIYAKITGPIVMVGFGSIGKGTLPMIERHLDYDKSRVTVIDPKDEGRKAHCEKQNVRFIQKAVTRDNYRELLTPLLTEGGGQGFCVNLSVDTGSTDIMELCNELGALYIDTVNEPWLGFYFDSTKGPEARSNYALREVTLAAKKARPAGSTTAVSCCGANPGMVSFFVKQALLNVAADLKLNAPKPKTKAEWADLMRQAGIKGIHIAERDTQRSKTPKEPDVFVNTWSVEGFLSEGVQPSELGWGTHEKWMPENARTHEAGCGAAIYLMQPGANTRVRTWCPTRGAQYGFLVTHNESISISDYFTVRDASGKAIYRPTCHYAYHPADDAVLSLHEMFRPRREDAGEAPHPRRERDRRRHRRARRAAVRPRQQCLLVRLAALDRRDPRARALSERDRPAGDLRRARRHGVGAGKPQGRHRRSRRDGFRSLAGNPAAVSRPGEGFLHRLDAADGSSGTVPGRHRHQRSLAIPEYSGAVIAHEA